MAKDFLNESILGDGAGSPTSREFRLVETQNITSPGYKSQYFEAFPTVWAAGYALRRQLEKGDEEARKEWAALFLLYEFKVIALKSYKKDSLDEDTFWSAVSDTYPPLDELPDLRLLEVADESITVVVGAYYPDVVFFPSRGREKWQKSEKLKPYLDDEGRLSWEKCFQSWLANSPARQRKIHSRLRRIADNLLKETKLKDGLNEFCQSNFGDAPEGLDKLDSDPTTWDVGLPSKQEQETEAQQQENAARERRQKEQELAKKLLAEYPLQKPNDNGGTTYYLVANLPIQSTWMKQTLPDYEFSGLDVAPNQYREKERSREITVTTNAGEITCRLPNRKDEVIWLDKLLIESSTWCKVSADPEIHVAHIRELHEPRDFISGKISDLTKERPICLFPAKQEFLTHFPEIFEPNAVTTGPSASGEEATLEWRLLINGKSEPKEKSEPLELRWETKYKISEGMADTSLQLWPPKISQDWKLYLMHEIGGGEDVGQWHLVGRNGISHEPVILDEEKRISYLKSEGDTISQPCALRFEGADGEEQGMVFLKSLEPVTINDETSLALALDFGTNNTCLAVKSDDSEPQTLQFSLSPRTLWESKDPDSQREKNLETPGFVPRQWGGEKGFFPSILLSRKNVQGLSEVLPENLELKHLFNVDIPGLHKKLDTKVYQGGLKEIWDIHPDLKWVDDDQKKLRWRSLFLELTLLYAHAEIFFKRQAKISKYVFTYPLVFSDAASQDTAYHRKAQDAITKIRHYCYGEALAAPGQSRGDYETVDESTAIAASTGQAGQSNVLEVFIDVGGGTTDIALRHVDKFFLLDSVAVAGKAFFRFAKRNFNFDVNNAPKGAEEFRKYLGQLLHPEGKKINIDSLAEELKKDFGVYYGVAVNELSVTQFKEREDRIYKQQKGIARFYQRYRSFLFFRHLLAYALLQTCATVIANKDKLTAPSISLTLSGNGWGLLLFAGQERKGNSLKTEASKVLNVVRKFLAEAKIGADTPLLHDSEKALLDKLQISAVDLLNERDFGKAKNSVAKGALYVFDKGGGDGDGEGPTKVSYAGFTIPDLSFGDSDQKTIRWCTPWIFEHLSATFDDMDPISDAKFTLPSTTDSTKAMDAILKIFPALGSNPLGTDILPPEIWQKINGHIESGIKKIEGVGGNLSESPLNYFLAQILYADPKDMPVDFLDALARKAGVY